MKDRIRPKIAILFLNQPFEIQYFMVFIHCCAYLISCFERQFSIADLAPAISGKNVLIVAKSVQKQPASGMDFGKYRHTDLQFAITVWPNKSGIFIVQNT
jgi:hypothetical protein